MTDWRGAKKVLFERTLLFTTSSLGIPPARHIIAETYGNLNIANSERRYISPGTTLPVSINLYYCLYNT